MEEEEVTEICLDLQLPNDKTLKDFLINLNDFNIGKVLGEGAFGVVRIATDSKGTKYALKCIKIKDHDKIQETKILFKNEVENLARFDHHTLLGFRGFAQNCKDSSESFLLTEYCEKGELKSAIDMESKNLSILDDTKKFIIIYGIAYGMQILHKNNIIHLDIKPENVFLNDELEPKIADFGLSKEIKTEAIFQSKTVGTPLFMAPEIFESNCYSFSVDVYAFGMLLYILLTNENPFPDIEEIYQLTLKICGGIRPKFPFELYYYQDLICRCWDQDPMKRPTFDDIVKELNDYDLVLLTEYDLDSRKIDNYIQKLQTGTTDIKRAKKAKTAINSKPKSKKRLTAIQKLKISAENGNEDAQVKFAIRLQTGEGIKIDFEKAAEYLKRASEKGSVDAMVRYGLCLLEGKGVEKADPTKAAEQFKKAINIEEDPTAMYHYAILLLEGNGVDKNYKEAINYLKKAAEKGNLDASNKYAMILESEKKFDEAVIFYKNASDHGNDAGMYNYADILAKGKYVPQNLKESARLLRLCIKRGYVPAMVKYGEMLMEGNGVQKDLAEARRLFVHALQDGYASAYVSLGQMYLTGNDEIKKNENEATRLFKKAADAGDVRGMIQYAVSLEEGIGCEKDVVKALELYQEAIKKGSIIALTKAAKLFLLGEDGIEEDLGTAIDYLSIAADNGDEEAISILNDLNED